MLPFAGFGAATRATATDRTMNTGCTIGRGAQTFGAGGRGNTVYHGADDIRFAVPDGTGC